jgi:hypothetical protein
LVGMHAGCHGVKLTKCALELVELLV